MDLEPKLGKLVKLVNKELKSELRFSWPAKLYNATRWLIKAGGKRLRPVLALLACEAVGGRPERALKFALALELVHNFTLIHDDIMDKDEFRRGVATVHCKFGESTAINAGDALFAHAFETLSSSDLNSKILNKVTHEFAKTIREIAEGQQLDLEFETRKKISIKDYLKMIELKTSRLLELATKGGALIGKGTKQQVNNLAQYGKCIGLGFQIWDDFLGIAGDPKKLGKPVGNDLRRGKKTLIVVHALSKVKGEDRKFILRILGNQKATQSQIQNTIKILEKTGSIDYARDCAITFASRAKQALASLPSTEARGTLELIADYAVGRDR